MLLLARWLGPVEFGLIGMIAIFIGIGSVIVDSGLTASLIRTKDAGPLDFNTVFYMNMGLSLLVYLLVFLAAPYIAGFFDQAVLTSVIRVYCLSFIITAFSAVQLALLNKEMRFKQIMKLNTPGTILGAITGLVMGYMGYGVWSIVAMFLTTQLVLSVLLWVSASWKPAMVFSAEKMHYHYGFGYKLMLSGLLDTIFTNSYFVVIGKFFPVQVLGFFERADRLTQFPSKTFTETIGKVTYPMLSKLQHDPLRMSRIYQRLVRLTFFCTAPVMLGAAAVANPLFEWLLGPVWKPAVPYFQILSLAAMLYPIHAFNLNVLKVFGRSDLFLRLEVFKKVIVVISILVGLQFGMLGLVWSMVFTSVIALLINTWYSSSLIQYSTKKQFLDLFPILLLAGITFGLMHITIEGLYMYSNGVKVGGALVLGALFYLGVHSFFIESPLYDLVTLIKRRKI